MTDLVPSAAADPHAAIDAAAISRDRILLRVGLVALVVALMGALIGEFIPFVAPENQSFWDPRSWLSALILGALYGAVLVLFQWAGELNSRRLRIWSAAAIAFTACALLRHSIPASHGAAGDLGFSPLHLVRNSLLLIAMLSAAVAVGFPIAWAYRGVALRPHESLVRIPPRRAPRSLFRRGGQ